MQDTFARAAARPSARATIGYLVYNGRPSTARDERVICIQEKLVLIAIKFKATN